MNESSKIVKYNSGEQPKQVCKNVPISFQCQGWSSSL